MGKAVIKAADSAGLQLVPVSFGCEEEAGKTVEVCGKEIHVHGPSDRESVLASAFREHPNMIVVDYTVPDAVNSKILPRVPFNCRKCNLLFMALHFVPGQRF